MSPSLLRPQAELLRTPGAARLVGASLLARLSTASIGLPLILLGADATGSYAGGGAASAAFGVGVAVAAPARGRLIDRRGARQALPWLIAGNASATVTVAATGASGLAPAMVACALVMGLSVPSLPAAMRLEWQRLLDPGPPLERAYGFEATAQVSLFIVGPLLAAGGVALAGPAWTLVACAAVMVAAGLTFARRARRPGTGSGAGAAGLGPIRLPGVRALVVAVLLADVALGAVEVGVIAFVDERGAGASAGLLLAIWSAAAVLGSLAYSGRDAARPRGGRGARRRHGPVTPAARLAAIMVVSATLSVPPALAGSVPVLAVLLAVAGLPFAVQFAAATIVLDVVAPADAAAEAYNWLSAANSVGVSIGAVLAGALADGPGPAAALLSGSFALATAATVVLARRRVLTAHR